MISIRITYKRKKRFFKKYVDYRTLVVLKSPTNSMEIITIIITFIVIIFSLLLFIMIYAHTSEYILLGDTMEGSVGDYNYQADPNKCMMVGEIRDRALNVNHLLDHTLTYSEHKANFILNNGVVCNQQGIPVQRQEWGYSKEVCSGFSVGNQNGPLLIYGDDNNMLCEYTHTNSQARVTIGRNFASALEHERELEGTNTVLKQSMFTKEQRLFLTKVLTSNYPNVYTKMDRFEPEYLHMSSIRNNSTLRDHLRNLN